MLREIRGALTALALVACVALAAASISIWQPGQALLASLRFHIAAGLFVLIVLLALSRAWRRALLFLVPLGASLGQGALVIYNQQQPRIEAAAEGMTPLFKVMSFNLMTDNRNGARVAEYIVASGADVVMLMEATPLRPYRDRLLESYPYVAGCEDFSRCGTTILSRTPLEDIKLSPLSAVWPDRLVTAATEIGGTRVNLVLAHLVKPYFDEFPFEETHRLAKAMEGLDGPLLLAGDFNAAAWSDNIDRLVQRAGLLPPPMYPATWPVRAGPLGVPIDNLFTRGSLVIDRIEAFADAMGSNHRGLTAEVSLTTGS